MAWSGSKPSVDHFRVFGCISHVHIPDSKRIKLDDKSVRCVLLRVTNLDERLRSEKGLYEEEDTAYQALFASNDLVSFSDAVKSMKWRKTMDVEIEAIKRNDTWELTDLPTEAKKVGLKWVYKIKFNENGEVDNSVRYNSSGDFSCSSKGVDNLPVRHKEVLERFNIGQVQSSSQLYGSWTQAYKRNGDGVKIDSTFYKIVGSLMYLTATRLDVMFVEGNGELITYTNSDYAWDLDDKKNISSYVFMLSSEAVSWSSKKQPVVSLSTTEAEFIATTSCACQAIWLRKIIGRSQPCLT
ncbi:Retrovirus-related Pol polyprotein from transposon TNT 1-94 [Vitis vinifera]|uniref:Retrovirus-related Pol polyprotein from transposon TNT 1-94 n=1 Tax=Vitis vinifera TaxID=29760 RepID=A0A438H649_VITVI|nr:Retrovirus-related Pol polyprotein from transposon TNT 1-94 [Vitis vinifera]